MIPAARPRSESASWRTCSARWATTYWRRPSVEWERPWPLSSDGELENLLAAAFVRLSAEANIRRHYGAVSEVCGVMEVVSARRPALADDLRPRIGVENRLPEFIEEALHLPRFAPDLIQVLRRTTQAATEHIADRFFRCMRREECDRIVELFKELGAAGLAHLREQLRMGQPRQATAVVGLMSRLDVTTLLELLPNRLREWNRFYHDMVVRQIAFGAAPIAAAPCWNCWKFSIPWFCRRPGRNRHERRPYGGSVVAGDRRERRGSGPLSAAATEGRGVAGPAA